MRIAVNPQPQARGLEELRAVRAVQDGGDVRRVFAARGPRDFVHDRDRGYITAGRASSRACAEAQARAEPRRQGRGCDDRERAAARAKAEAAAIAARRGADAERSECARWAEASAANARSGRAPVRARWPADAPGHPRKRRARCRSHRARALPARLLPHAHAVVADVRQLYINCCVYNKRQPHRAPGAARRAVRGRAVPRPAARRADGEFAWHAAQLDAWLVDALGARRGDYDDGAAAAAR